MAKEQKNLPSWVELGLPDLRHLPAEFWIHQELVVVESGNDEAEALLLLESHLGFYEDDILELAIETPVSRVLIRREFLPHIVEKRIDARERYAHHALAAMMHPFEVWKVAYDDGASRLAFIGVFEGKTQMLVIVTMKDGCLLWNYMHSDRKSLNKHRHGELIYRSHGQKDERRTEIGSA